MAKTDYKTTLNLPATDFPMKANLAQREPQILEMWQKQDVHGKLRKQRAGRERWVLHDGPPYANGDLHIGHALNKILKDVVVKCATLNGYDSPYVPGWDCHGLPIEVNVEKKLGRPKTKEEAAKFRVACREYAQKWLDVQREGFKRMGVIGNWDDPYITMDFKAEANIVRALAQVYKNGHIERGYKPVNWCLNCQSALAEAEVEYKDKVSPSISVGFPLPEEQEAEFFKRCGAEAGGEGQIMFVIWTTTPWTIPSNRTVTLNPKLSYTLVQTEKDGKKMRLLLSSKLKDELLEKYGLPLQASLAEVTGEQLEKLVLRHPYYEGRDSLVTLGDYVSDEEGTGLVHSAPAYGLDDFHMGNKYGLELDNPVSDYGKFAADRELVGGWHIFKQEKELIQLIADKGCLIHNEEYEHQYPHCWRHKTPVIYRATRQWFISMTKADLIGKVLKETAKVRWTPAWGQNRIELMMKNRPDWCISRQRHWGVPIPFFVHKETDEPHPQTDEITERVASLIEKKGVDAWYETTAEELLDTDSGDYTEYIKGDHVLDVWFDSGSTHYSILRQREDLMYPATMYLEGSDQHRGWFQSSILCGVAMDEIAPYKEVLTHGFTVDSEGHKMSKSIGNVIEPGEVINRLGADVLRWWVISSDYANEMVISQDILNSAGDIYRKIRNTLRFLLANLHDFDPAKHSVKPEEMLSLDKWLLSRGLGIQEELKKLFYDYNYPVACRKIHSFCVRELGGFYLDIVKDRQYTMHKESKARRSAQTAMFHTLEAVVRWITPILSFTAEEVWQLIPGKRDSTVLTTEWYDGLVDLQQAKSSISDAEWQDILAVKEQLNRVVEGMRGSGALGAALEANVVLYCDDKLMATLAKLEDELKFFLITSAASLQELSKAGGEGAVDTGIDGLKLKVETSPHDKCVRCWHRCEDLGQNKEHPELCGRCVSNLSAPGEERKHG